MGLPVALFGAVWFVFALLSPGSSEPARRRCAKASRATCSSPRRSGCAIILYLAYAAFFVLKVVCFLCLATYAAVIGLFVVSGLVTTMPMTKIPRRIPRDLRALAGSPAALAAVIVFVAGVASALAFFPSEERLRAEAAQQRRRGPLPTRRRVREVVGGAAADHRAGALGWGGGGRGQVHRPAVRRLREHLRRAEADPGEVPVALPGRRQVHREGLSAVARLQPGHHARRSTSRRATPRRRSAWRGRTARATRSRSGSTRTRRR